MLGLEPQGELFGYRLDARGDTHQQGRLAFTIAGSAGGGEQRKEQGNRQTAQPERRESAPLTER